MNPLENGRKRALTFALGVMLTSPGALQAQLTDIADGPLAQPATSVKPNMLLILDDSGSMARQFMPDYVSSNVSAGTVANCRDSLDGDGLITSDLRDCFAGDPPAMSPDFNTQYYNPEIRYFPAVNYDGSSKGEMSSAATTGWSAVPTDNVSTSTSNQGRKSPHGGTLSSTTASGQHWDLGSPSTPLMSMDLAAGFPDRVWCNSTSAAATDTVNCKTNSAYSYPDSTFGYGRDGASNRKYKLGAPYYYRILVTEYCNNPALISNASQSPPGCIASTVPTIFSGVSYNFPAPVRFCDSTAHTNCQKNRSSTFRFPKFLGTGAPSGAARGKIILSAGDSGAPTIQQITVTKPDSSTVNLLGSALTTVATNSATNRTTAATDIMNAIDANFGGHNYNASLGPTGGSTQEIWIDAPGPGVDNNGSTLTVSAPATSSTPASLSFNIGGAGSSSDRVNYLRIGPPGGPAVDLIASSVSCGPGCTNANMATNLRNAINALTGTHGYTASGSSSTVTITAPAGTGSERNGWPMIWSDSGLTDQSGSLSGGTTVGDLAHSTSNFTTGGIFVRTNIVPGFPYPKAPARSDCAGATSCTYEEEMTNFANWFAYYRTRMQMAKTSIGRAFLALSSDFRIGFKTINFSSSYYLAVNDFNTGAGQQKELWFGELYGAVASGSTPLRGALARAGRYFGDQNPNSMGASPIQLACQPNYAILTTDGYWNDSSSVAVQLNGTSTVGNQDSGGGADNPEVPPYATKASGSWDGNAASNTLADVAMYYYKNDLRSDLADQVPPSGDDSAPHQHMTTFTVGMGLAGTLLYDPNYKTQQTGDFKDITTATKFWPVPVGDDATALDDVWHAAVNGRGKFFSASDPVALANGLAETLNAVQSRIGAGAAAATSNLQPVAGDNFAFTAQYQTIEWSGDLKARTIDLSTGAVATRELWSAQALLDQRKQTGRRIYTFDPSDVSPGGDNWNKLKVFCWPGAQALPDPDDLTSPFDPLYPGCQGEPELSTTELDANFDPLGGPNGALLQSIPWPTDGSNRNLSATKNNLVDFLRGDTTNETSGGTGLTDLYRNRANLLGDIVNAQPAYVKQPPFAYAAPSDSYKLFKSAQANRTGRVYAASNDGMLHAFATDPDNNPYFQVDGIASPETADDTFQGTPNTDPVAGDGSESWAYIPSMVFPQLKRLAETNYGTNHRYLVDGSPVVGDVCTGACAAASDWRTILVAGLNKGGRGYYALDITDPQNPKALWELKGGSDAACIASDVVVDGSQSGDCNIGFSFGNPLIVKRPSDSRWVVIVSSGHNNVSPGDGVGRLYVVDATSGMILQRLSTGAGNSTTPSGLGRINGWVDNATVDNTARTVYGGDLLGNVWRFELQGATGVPANSVSLLASVKDPNNVAQPITVRPELALIQPPFGTNKRVVYVATGKFLGLSDKTTEQRQTIYAIKDEHTAAQLSPALVNMTRPLAGFVQQTLTTSGTTRTVANPQTVNFDMNNGWFIDLPDGGSPGSPSERVNVDPVLQLGTLVVPSNVPSSDTCVAGGYGWVNFLDYRSGSYVEGSSGNMASTKISASVVVGINVVQLPGGTVKTIVTTADNQQITQETPVKPANVAGGRATWRELFVE